MHMLTGPVLNRVISCILSSGRQDSASKLVKLLESMNTRERQQIELSSEFSYRILHDGAVGEYVSYPEYGGEGVLLGEQRSMEHREEYRTEVHGYRLWLMEAGVRQLQKFEKIERKFPGNGYSRVIESYRTPSLKTFRAETAE